MPPVEFELTILAGERSQTYDVDRAAIGTGGVGLEMGSTKDHFHAFKYLRRRETTKLVPIRGFWDGMRLCE
jgi:hypothetical protein